MITNFWPKVRLFCGNHPEEEGKIEMCPHNPASGSISAGIYGNQSNMFYSCPRYYPEKRKEGEKCCRNHISLKEYEGMLNHLSKIVEEGEALGGTVELVGEKWKSRQGVEYCVFHQSDNHIDVKCLNRKDLRK